MSTFGHSACTCPSPSCKSCTEAATRTTRRAYRGFARPAALSIAIALALVIWSGILTPSRHIDPADVTLGGFTPPPVASLN